MNIIQLKHIVKFYVISTLLMIIVIVIPSSYLYLRWK